MARSFCRHGERSEAIHFNKTPIIFPLTLPPNVIITNLMSGLTISQRITRIVANLAQSLNIFAPRVKMPVSLCQILSRRLTRLMDRLRTLIERGPLPPSHKRATPRNPPTNPPKIDELHPPSNFGWLAFMFPGSDISAMRSHLLLLLDEPETQSLITSHPMLARSLRPLCHMLGIKPPACLKLPRKPRTKREPSSTPPRQKIARKIWRPAPPIIMTPAMAQLAARQFFNPRDFYL